MRSPRVSMDLLQQKGLNLPSFEPGWVWICGAGPGDPGLLTLHALNALETADCVVHDALVDTRILALARVGAELIFAGKRGGKPSAVQQDISDSLVELAKAGKRVLRLKGGDPLTFARGAEEALALVKAGVRFRILPGVTSGIGALAYAGIPLTARETNQAVTFITGHTWNGTLPHELDWHALSRGSPVLVIYMGLKHLEQIAQKLISVGRDKNEPVALISHATTPQQVVLETTLAQAFTEAQETAIGAPALIVIGEVVRFRAGLDWLGAMSGKILSPDPLNASIVDDQLGLRIKRVRSSGARPEMID